jgi:tRNA(Arg) A34 adenosine deaminase TadA
MLMTFLAPEKPGSDDGSHAVSFTLPPWAEAHARAYVATLDAGERMAFLIEALRKNIAAESGGPFTAGVFEIATGKLVALGVNLVVPHGISVLHAEIVAIMRAQSLLGIYDLGGEGAPACELMTTAEPCAMCFGAILWSGVKRVTMGARSCDVEKLGFDEGPKVAAWREEFALRGIETVCDVDRARVVGLLEDYASRGGKLYNARGHTHP